MKRHKHLFEQVCSFENLHAAAYAALKGKRGKKPAAAFFAGMEEELVALRSELLSGTYQPGAYHYFQIHEPKERRVAAAPFRDRVVHHAMVRVVEPLFERRYIEDSYACLKGRGTHAGMRRAAQFTRIRCDHCKKDHLLAFSCKGRWFCPSCHQKKVQIFGALLAESVLYPVPHRHYTLTIPNMLWPYFRFNRDQLKELCRIARDCVVDYQRTVLHLPDGLFGAVMAIHTFGEYLDFHPHLHALVADGLFQRGGWFHVLPETGIRPLEQLFRARTIAFLTREGLLPPERARMLLSWKHSGFCVHRSKRVQPHQKEDLERLAQYIIRNPFALEKMHPDPEKQAGVHRL